MAGHSFGNIIMIHSSNLDLEALELVRAVPSEFPQNTRTVEGVDSRMSCTVPMDDTLLQIVRKYGERILLKESDRKPKISKKKGKKQSSADLICKERRIENVDDFQGPPPWDLSLGDDGCPKFLCDVMVSGSVTSVKFIPYRA